MKVVKKLRSSKNVGVKFAAKISNVGEELFSMLLGMELYFSQSPQQYVKSMGLENEEEVVNAMIIAGYLTGDSDSWKINPEIKKAVFRQLSRMPEFARISLLEPSERPVPLHTLVNRYRRHVDDINKYRVLSMSTRLPRDKTLFLRFRTFCRKYDSRDIFKAIDKFFKLAKINADFSLEFFEKYLADLARFHLISTLKQSH
jgi:hypothetical protein